MSERPVAPCDEYQGDLAELALGILTGRACAAALAHVETCAACADELEHLSRTADAVVRLAPEAEPPVGFEVRLFDRMGVTALPSASQRVTRLSRPRLTRWVMAAAAAVVALGLGLGLGLSGRSGSGTATEAAGHPFAQAELVEHGQQVGHVFIYGGAHPWMFVTVADSSARGPVTCRVVTADGQHHAVGSFTATHGYGAWAAPLHVSPSQVRTAQVVSPSGTVIATAPLG